MTKEINVPIELIEKLKENRCVAFIGAGLSMGAGLPDWYGLMDRMIIWGEKKSISLPEKSELKDLLNTEQYPLLAEILIESLGIPRYQEFLKEVFRDAKLKPTETHSLLPQILFSAVLTSNYDKLIEGAYTAFNKGVQPPLFTQLDTAELATSLQSNSFYILKTHGDIDRVNSIVLGRKQYRELLYNNTAYKLHMQQVLSSKTILFLGFGLTDPDLFSVLDELSVAFKGNTTPHYALMDATKLNSLKVERFRKDYNINIIPYNPSDNTHSEVPEFLQEIINRTPKKHQVSLDKAKQDLEDIDPHYKFVANTDGKYILKEKYPGAAKENPIKFNQRFEFDTTTEKGREALEKVKKMFEAGDEVELTEEFIADAEIPEIFQKIIPGKIKPIKITMGSNPSGSKLNLNLVINSNEGNTAKIENIMLENIKSGTKTSTYNNANQKHPFKVAVAFPVEKGNLEAKVNFSYDPSNTNIKQALEAEKFLSTLSEGGELLFEDPSTGVSFASSEIPPGMVASSKPGGISMLEKLTVIQRKTKVVFPTPLEIMKEEIRPIQEVYYILENGKGTVSFSVQATMDRKAVENILEDKFFGEIVTLTEQTYIILGKHVSMGEVYYSCRKMEVSYEEKQRLTKELEDESKDSFNLVLQSAKEPFTTAYYLNYLSKEDFENIFSDKYFRQHSLKVLVEMLIDSVIFEKADNKIHSELLISLFIDAKKQTSRFGTPFNMLGRCSKEELENSLKPYTKILDENTYVQLINTILNDSK